MALWISKSGLKLAHQRIVREVAFEICDAEHLPSAAGGAEVEALALRIEAGDVCSDRLRRYRRQRRFEDATLAGPKRGDWAEGDRMRTLFLHHAEPDQLRKAARVDDLNLDHRPSGPDRLHHFQVEVRRPRREALASCLQDACPRGPGSDRGKRGGCQRRYVGRGHALKLREAGGDAVTHQHVAVAEGDQRADELEPHEALEVRERGRLVRVVVHDLGVHQQIDDLLEVRSVPS